MKTGDFSDIFGASGRLTLSGVAETEPVEGTFTMPLLAPGSAVRGTGVFLRHRFLNW